MVKIVIGSVECLFPERVPAEAFEKLQKTLDDAPNGVDFHCSQCGSLRPATFDPGLLVKYPMTCLNAPGQPACDRVPTPMDERKPATYRPGSLVFVKGLPEARDANWPAIIEDDPYNRHQFMIVSRKTDGRETPVAYWVTLAPVGKEPRDYRGGFIRAENLVPFLPIQPPPDCSELYKSALEQATIAFHLDLVNRLKMLSFVVRASFLAENPLPEPTFFDHNPELGTPVVESSKAGPSGVGSSEAGPSGGATFSGERPRSARIDALRARLAARPSEEKSPGYTASRGPSGTASRTGTPRNRSSERSDEDPSRKGSTERSTPGESQHDYQLRTLLEIGTRWQQGQKRLSEAASSSGPTQWQDVDPTPAETHGEFLLRMAWESGFKVKDPDPPPRERQESGAPGPRIQMKNKGRDAANSLRKITALARTIEAAIGYGLV